MGLEDDLLIFLQYVLAIPNMNPFAGIVHDMSTMHLPNTTPSRNGVFCTEMEDPGIVFIARATRADHPDHISCFSYLVSSVAGLDVNRVQQMLQGWNPFCDLIFSIQVPNYWMAEFLLHRELCHFAAHIPAYVPANVRHMALRHWQGCWYICGDYAQIEQCCDQWAEECLNRFSAMARPNSPQLGSPPRISR